jgi:LysM domain
MNDGHVITAGDETLRAGWTLELPAGAMDADLDREDEAVVGLGDNFWDLAEEQLAADLGLQPSDQEVAPYWRDIVAANMDRLVQPGNPDLVVPGQVLVLPPSEHPVAPAPQAEPLAAPDAHNAPAPSAEPSPTPSPSTSSSSTTTTTTAPSTTATPDDAAPTSTADAPPSTVDEELPSVEPPSRATGRGPRRRHG